MASHLSGLITYVFVAIKAAQWLRNIAPLTVVLLIYVACFRGLNPRSK